MENEIIASVTAEVCNEDIASIGAISVDIKNKLKNVVPRAEDLRRFGICLFEAEANLSIHSIGGTLEIVVTKSAIKVVSRDKGPGIADMNKALTPGFSTAPPWARELGFGSGMGLKNIKRLADNFSIYSSDAGTVLSFEIKINEN